MVLFNFPLPEELLAQVKLYCKQRKISYAEFMRRAIKVKLKLEPPTCNICHLPSLNPICFDCFDTLPDNDKQNYHPLK